MKTNLLGVSQKDFVNPDTATCLALLYRSPKPLNPSYSLNNIHVFYNVAVNNQRLVEAPYSKSHQGCCQTEMVERTNKSQELGSGFT